MIASILARTCSVDPFDALDPVRKRFDFTLPFIGASNCKQQSACTALLTLLVLSDVVHFEPKLTVWRWAFVCPSAGWA